MATLEMRNRLNGFQSAARVQFHRAEATVLMRLPTPTKGLTVFIDREYFLRARNAYGEMNNHSYNLYRYYWYWQLPSGRTRAVENCRRFIVII